MRILPLAFAMLAAASPAFSQQADIGARTTSPEELFRQMGDQTPEQDMERLIAQAAAYPLGTIENPVRVGGPDGERGYLARLTCQDGTPLRIGSRSEAGQGGFGSIASAYSVSCGGTTRRIVFDMHHAEHREDRAPPGYAIR